MTIGDWIDITKNFIGDSTDRILNFIPNLIGAILIVVVGLIVAAVFKWVVITILEAARIQKLFDQIRFTEVMKKAGLPTSIPGVTGEFVKWLTIILFLIPASKVLYMDRINELLENLLQYIPNVIIASTVLLVGIIIANFLGNIVKAAAAGIGTHTAGMLSVITRYVVYIFISVAAFMQLGVPSYIINVFYTGLVAAIAIAGGLAFGLGGQSAATDLIKKMRDDFKKS